MRKKYVFFDADGTILDIEKGVPADVKAAIGKLIQTVIRPFCAQDEAVHIFRKKWKNWDLQV